MFSPGNTMSIHIQRQLATGRQVPELGFVHPTPNPAAMAAVDGAGGDEDFIDTGAAVLAFYSTLVDLLGRCAPETSVIAQGKNDSLRARAILRSLVPLEDLQGEKVCPDILLKIEMLIPSWKDILYIGQF